MSYEGYDQILCKNSHYHTADAYDNVDYDTWVCPICESPCAWYNVVNTTNGSFERDPETGEEIRIDGYVELEEDGYEDLWQTDHRGNPYVSKRYLYKIPEGVGIRRDV